MLVMCVLKNKLEVIVIPRSIVQKVKQQTRELDQLKLNDNKTAKGSGFNELKNFNNIGRKLNISSSTKLITFCLYTSTNKFDEKINFLLTKIIVVST